MERWRWIDGYEGYYEVSDLGRVRRLETVVSRGGPRAHTVTWPSKIMKLTPDEEDGYLRLTLCRDGVARTHRVHHLVAAAFIGARPAGMDVLHADDIKRNNVLGNLRYGNAQDNADDRTINGRLSKGSDRYNAKLDAEKVREIRRLRASMSLHELGRMFGVRHSAISHVIAGRTWRHVR